MPTLRSWFLPVLVVLGAASSLLGQTSWRGWGLTTFDTAVHDLPATLVGAGDLRSFVLRTDGRLFVRGWQRSVPPPTHLRFRTWDEDDLAVGILTDGRLYQYGQIQAPLPTLPAGVSVVTAVTGGSHALALGSDGWIYAWGDNRQGQCNVPVLAPGLHYTQVAAAFYYSLAVVSDGTLRAWGTNAQGQLNAPQLPAGVRWTTVAAGGWHAMGIRSDGQLEAWGDNSFGQTNVPALPPGLVYTAVTGTWHGLALRSDGSVVGWGRSLDGQTQTPPLPPSTRYTQIGAGRQHSIALRSDGQVVSWGLASSMQGDVPDLPLGREFVDVANIRGAAIAIDSTGALWSCGYSIVPPPPIPPAGVRWTQIAADGAHCAGLWSDGTLHAWGDNTVGQCNIAPLPLGMRYVQVECAFAHTIALRSDGQALVFGNVPNTPSIPALPAGLRYVEVAANDAAFFLRRSDGVVVAAAADGRANAPAAPPDTEFTQLAATGLSAFALRSDGRISNWGLSLAQSEPPLPVGVHYVEIAAGLDAIVARRSDGQVVAWDNWQGHSITPPALDPGTTYTRIAAADYVFTAIVGPTTTYTTHTQGCAGTLPTTSLVPRDTPKLGNTLRVFLNHLPVDAAFMTFGFTRPTSPIPLGMFGLPQCSAAVVPDATLLVLGQNRRAVFELPIPDFVGLLGLSFHNQAVVLDPASGNLLGAVLSDAATGVIGR